MVDQKTLLNIVQAAERRRSIRSYQDRPIPESDLREILRVAGLAPSAWNIQPWRVTVVRDPELKARLQEAAYGQRQVGSAPAVLVVWSDMRGAFEHMDEFVHPGMSPEQGEAMKAQIREAFSSLSPESLEEWGKGQTYIFLGYLLLAIASFGYASSPMLGFDPAAVKRLLGLPEHATIPALVAVGEAAEEGFPHHRHPLERFVSFVG
ncbi:MAG: nitroreductase family protein [Fimbriimonadales bacterium]|nr:nitroreductase family protein [Fimbriimonadales bacterium]